MFTTAQRSTHAGKTIQLIPANIAQFFQTNHVVSIAACVDGTIWSACCFYVFDRPTAWLIVLTSQKTKHGRMMAVSPHIAGTVAGQPSNITKISGIRFTTRVRLLEDEAAKKPTPSSYCKTRPAARTMKSGVWVLDLDTVKFTDNKLVFAQETHWRREES